jgi:hypothetical protein
VALAGLDPELYEVYECLEFRNFIRAYPTEADALRALAGGTTAPEPPAPPAPARAVEAAPVPDGVDDVLDGSPPRVPAPDPWEDDPFPVSSPPTPDDESAWRRRSWKGIEERDAAAGTADDAGSRPETSGLDVNEAQPDSRVGQDERIRSMGWSSYGEALRRRAGKDGGKDGGKGDGSGGTSGGDEDA